MIQYKKSFIKAINNNIEILDESFVDFISNVFNENALYDNQLNTCNQLINFFNDLFDGNINDFFNELISENILPTMDFDYYRECVKDLTQKDRDTNYFWLCLYSTLLGNNTAEPDTPSAKFYRLVFNHSKIWFVASKLNEKDFSFVTIPQKPGKLDNIDLIESYENLGAADKYYVPITSSDANIKLPEENEKCTTPTPGIELIKNNKGIITFNPILIEDVNYVWVPIKELKKFKIPLEFSSYILRKDIVVSHAWPYTEVLYV